MTTPDRPLSCLLHATCLEIAGSGVLICGPPGAGKSDLALRLLDQPGLGLTGAPAGAVLVADDQVVLTTLAGRLLARPPERLQGLLEIRGLGILKVPFRSQTTVGLMVVLASASTIDRMPEADDLVHDLLGVKLPLLRLDAQYASAPARVRAALESLSLNEPNMISTASY
jgi:serine kinase of HPr protein (carbohydrate metabolism regulator)